MTALTVEYESVTSGLPDGAQVGKSATEKVGFWGATPVVRPAALTTQLTRITHTAPGSPEYAIQDLINSSAYGFASKDEGNTVLSVIRNLQVRVAELEARLGGCGIVTANSEPPN